ncbi:FtsX-like permease family protein [Kitasatospora cineracea]|uniref:Putative ABC transport system permease protein n=1 Tax=Kitasatospora cineracea TaxID=88074 RepID=A0A8G1X7N6_9ACTN|nr:FtsX-like permease family protein [Kitasatospora cineracea]ROR35549.1 putative ABC transport system permease protein [Kitasatospora cineracea]
MSNGLARAAVRFRPASFAGTFLALLFASAIVTACGVLLQTGLTASVQPSRYADVPVVVAADQQVELTVKRGEDRETIAQPLPERARLDAGLTATVAALPGVAQALPDSSFPLSTTTAPATPPSSSSSSSSINGPGLTGRGWSALGIGPGERLTEGRAPSDGELVLDSASARAAHLSPGGTLTLTTPTGSASYRISGLAEARPGSPTAWFSDRTADRISGHPGRIDAVAVRPAASTDPRTLADELRHALNGQAQVSTGQQRGTVEQPVLHEAKAMLTALGASFGGMATMTAVFVVVSTVALATGQRAREFALLRTIGATPRQIRRSIAAEAVLVAPLAAAIGVLPGLALARWWFGELVARGAVPSDVELGVGPLPVLAAVVACTVTALAAGWFAARRSARMRPAQALGEANTGPGRPGRARTVTGAVFTAGAVAFAVVAANLTGATAANTALGVVLCFLVAVALLGPWLVRGAVGLLGVLLRVGGAPASLAADNARASSRRLASATVPIVMVTAFCGTLVFLQSSLQHTAAEHVRQGLTADQVVTAQAGRPGLPAGTVERARQVPGVSAAVGLRPTGLVYQQSDMLATATALGVDGDPAALPAVLDLGVRSGSLADLSRSPDTVALDATLADSLGVRVGQRAPLWLGDGTKAEPTVVATYSRGLGLGEALLPGATVAAHSSSAYPTQLLVAEAPGADRAATARALSELAPGQLSVTDRQGYAAQADRQRELSGWANNVMAAVLAGFAALAAANTLVMTVLDRRREIALLRLAGTTRRQVRAMLRWEALLIAVTGLATGAAIAWTTLTPITRALTSSTPHIPLGTALPLAAGAALLCLAATALPGRALLRSRPTATR